MSEKKKETAPEGASVAVLCPCCETRLLVDAATGVVLREDRKKTPLKSFEKALDDEKARRQASDQGFCKALKSQKDQQALLELAVQKRLLVFL